MGKGKVWKIAMDKKFSILIVEDDKEIRDGIEIFLRNQGYEVYKAANGLEGLKIVENHEIHLAVLDIMMPVMDGVTPLCAEHVMMRGLNDAGAPVFDFGSAFPLLGYDGVNSYLQTLSTIVAEQQGGAPAPYAASNEQKAAMPNHCAIYYQGMMLVMGLAPYVA